MENKAKTFPIRTTSNWLEEVKKAADKQNESMHEFIVDAVERRIKTILKKD